MQVANANKELDKIRLVQASTGMWIMLVKDNI
jgi:hypothetical protein